MKIWEIINEFGKIKSLREENGLLVAEISRDLMVDLADFLVNKKNMRLASFFGTDRRKARGDFRINAIFSADSLRERVFVFAEIPRDDLFYPSITTRVMAAHWYERYLKDMFGITPKGHPDLRRLVSHENIPENIFPLRKDFAWNAKFEKADVPYLMEHVKGDGIFEIPVGPIHAGIIEPGHFRFNVAGERIIALEGKLFFTHKGVEKIMEGKKPEEGLPFIERLSGDMAASHALAYIQAVEDIIGILPPKKALMIRSLFGELERLTMHIHDLGNMGGMGTGYSFIAANCFRIKERMMRLSEKVSGNRFWRGVNVIGGVSRDFSESDLRNILLTVKGAYMETKKIVETALRSEGFLDRLQTTGILPKDAAEAFGALGLPARASGINRDVRRDYPYAAYMEYVPDVLTMDSGDVYARFLLRFQELRASVDIIERMIKDMSTGEIRAQYIIKDGFALSAVESWRGEILCALEIKNGVIERCFPRDPSFCNWALFGILGPGNIVPDFPLCNKSLNLSYSGTDL